MLTLPISPLAKILWKRRRVSKFVAQQSSYTEIACCHVLLLYFIKFIFLSFPLFAIGLETVSTNKCLTESPYTFCEVDDMADKDIEEVTEKIDLK